MKIKLTGQKRSDEFKQQMREINQTGKHIKCEVCGKSKYFPINKIKRNQHYFCSHKCRSKGISLYYIGENASNWIDGRTDLIYTIRGCLKYSDWHAKVLKRDKYICQDCGDRGNNLEVHHTKPFRKTFKEFINFYSSFSINNDKDILKKLANKWNDFWDINNGITYCLDCHSENDTYRYV